MDIKNDTFWYDEPSILFRVDRLIEFVPLTDMTYYEKLNALMRFSLYSSILLILYNKKYTTLYFPLFMMGLTLYMYKVKVDEHETYCSVGNRQQNDSACGQSCTYPSINNPFMNVLINEYTDNPTRPKACMSEKVKEDIEKNFEHNLYQDSIDLWGRNNSQRQFYTNPNTTIPNDREKFANWLYKVKPTCKEMPKHCQIFEDLRHQRHDPIRINENVSEENKLGL